MSHLTNHTLCCHPAAANKPATSKPVICETTQSGRGGVGGKSRAERDAYFFVKHLCIIWVHLLSLPEFPVLGEPNKINIELWWRKKTNTKSMYFFFGFFFFCPKLKISLLLDRTYCHILALSESSSTSKHKSLNEATCCLALQFWILQTTSSFQSFLSKTTGKIVYSRGCAST